MNALTGETSEARQNAGAPALKPTELERLMVALKRRRWLFLAVALGVFVIVGYLLTSGAPRYTATATLLLDEHQPDVLHIQALTSSEVAESQQFTDSSAVDTEVEVLRSRALTAQVVDQLHLDRDPEFNAALRPPGRLALLLGHVPAQQGQGIAALLEREKIVNAVMADTDIRRTGLTYTINVSFTSFDPLKAQTIANAIVQSYLTEGLDTKVDASTSAASWLNMRLTQLGNDVRTAEAAVQQYKIANDLMRGAGSTLTEQEVSTVTSELAQARADEATQNARLETARRQLAAGSNGGDIVEALNNPVIQALRTQQAEASSHLADLEGRYGAKHPEVIKAKDALADLNAQIQVEIQRVISSLKAQSLAARTRTASLEASLYQTKGSLAGNERALVHLNELQSNADAAKAIYDAFLTRYKEALAKEGVQAPDAHIVTQAKIPTAPSWPNKKLGYVVALIVGAFAGGVAMVVAEVLRQGVFSGAEMEDAFDLPVLAELPSVTSTVKNRRRDASRRLPRLDPVVYVVAKPLSRFAEAFRNLRAAIATCRPGTMVKVVVFTSALPGEGKTTTAVCLGRTAALAGVRTVVVDCDLRQRSINRMLSVDPPHGLIEVLNGSVTLSEALIQDEDTGLMVLPVAKAASTPKDLFGTSEMKQLLSELRRSFDFVILDTAPILALSDTRILCPYADATIILTRWRLTPRRAVRAALRVLDTPEIFLGGAALTRVDLGEQARVGEGAGTYERAYAKYYVG